MYAPIRNQIVAHNITTDRQSVHELVERTTITEIQDILHFLYDILGNLWHLLWNGHRPVLGTFSREYEDRVKEEVRRVLNDLLPKKRFQAPSGIKIELSD